MREELLEKEEKKSEISEVEAILGYRFNDKSLLEEALTHASLSYDRLEYVGDAVLNLLFAKELYFLYPHSSSGHLTRLRASNVDTEKLARVALRHGLHRFLCHHMPLLHDQIEKFRVEIEEYPLHSNGLLEVPKVLADIVESSIGAVFIDSNSSIDTVWKVFKSLLEPIINQESMKTHPVTELYEFCQKHNKKLEFVDLWAQNGTFNVFVDGQLIGTASYNLKKEVAHNRAAKNALDNIIGLTLSPKNDNIISSLLAPHGLETVTLPSMIENNLNL